MKKLVQFNFLMRKSVVAIVLAGLFFTVACNSEFDSPALDAGVDITALDTESVAETDFEEIDDITSNIMGVAEASTGGRIADGGGDDRCHCAEITHDKEAQTITIDFGEGCEGPGGVVRKGIIFITYDGRRFLPGSQWTVTFREFFVDDKQIEGLRTVTNISESILANPAFHITLVGGKITWPDGTFATREVDKVRVWVRADNPLLDEYHILMGSVTSGTNKNAVNYNTEVLTDLVYKKFCRGDRRLRVPVQGTKQVVYGDRNCVVDFGDGECDSIVEVTCGSETTTYDLTEQGRFQKRNG